jgi:hypothetical protein
MHLHHDIQPTGAHMLKYRSLKILSDLWLHALTALCHAADAVHAAEQKALTYSNKLDEKAIDLAHEARDLLIQKDAGPGPGRRGPRQAARTC